MNKILKRYFSSRHPPPAIFGIGKNYSDHAKEMSAVLPDHPNSQYPLVFMKNPASLLLGNTGTIVIPKICQHPSPQVDYEGELAVIIGEDCKDVKSLSDALKYVSHYAVANDVSARWWQLKGSGGQFCRGKSFDTFCPMSEPTEASKVRDPQDLSIITRLNGQVMQNGHTSQMIFSVAKIIHELSQGMNLQAGTIVLTGTPAGVGDARKPPVYLKQGDKIEVEIPGVGLLKNDVVEE